MRTVFFAFIMGLALCGLARAQGAPDKLALCQSCHGVDGNSKDARYPVLAGQPAGYTQMRLQQFRGEFESPEMTPIARSLSEDDVRLLSEFFAGRKPAAGLAKFDAVKAVRGKELAARLRCAQCHESSYAGVNQMARLAGQHPGYLIAQMQLIRANKRSDDNGNMVDLLNRVSMSDVEDLAHFFASLP